MAPACAGFLSLAVNAVVRSPLAYDGQTLPDLRPSAKDLAKINHDLDDHTTFCNVLGLVNAKITGK